MKCLCRGGVPDRFRTQVWRQLVHCQVRDIMSAKGQHYYRNLCNMLPDSPVSSLQGPGKIHHICASNITCMTLKGIFLAVVPVIVIVMKGQLSLVTKIWKCFGRNIYTLRPCKDIHSKVNIIKHVFSILYYTKLISPQVCLDLIQSHLDWYIQLHVCKAFPMCLI